MAEHGNVKLARNHRTTGVSGSLQQRLSALQVRPGLQHEGCDIRVPELDQPGPLQPTHRRPRRQVPGLHSVPSHFTKPHAPHGDLHCGAGLVAPQPPPEHDHALRAEDPAAGDGDHRSGGGGKPERCLDAIGGIHILMGANGVRNKRKHPGANAGGQLLLAQLPRQLHSAIGPTHNLTSSPALELAIANLPSTVSPTAHMPIPQGKLGLLPCLHGRQDPHHARVSHSVRKQRTGNVLGRSAFRPPRKTHDISRARVQHPLALAPHQLLDLPVLS
mmetsp:Transcript_46058/g.100071  ORF Transcript_46058/g.100071 Transcript_46058/m.100071 type:complete len:274 (+) Transcript_46058:688-1509(+)